MRRLAVPLLAVLLIGAAASFYVLETSPPWFERLRYPLHFGAVVRERAHARGLDPALVAAVIYQESKFRTGARSSSGAVGLMQLTPATAQAIALRTGGTTFHVSDLTDPVINIRYGTGSASTGTSGSCSRRTTPGRGTSTAGGARVSASSSPRRGPTSTGSRS